MTSEPKRRVNHAAPGPYLGFALQPVRFCYLLLTSPADAEVSLELVDDVAVHYADGSIEYVQVKSPTSKNLVADWHEDLWKTFKNWLSDSAAEASKGTKQKFSLYVSPVRTGDFVQALSLAADEIAAANTLANIRSALAGKRSRPACADFMEELLNAPLADQIRIIQNFRLEGDDDPVQPIRKLLEYGVAPEALDAMCHSVIGQAKEQIDAKIRAGETPTLKAGPFQAEIRQFLRRNNLPALLEFSRPPASEHIDHLLSSRPTFIRQLELVEATEEELIVAVSTYLRASADKSKWAELGRIFPTTLDQWDADLVEQHGIVGAEIALVNGAIQPEKRGKLLYLKCAQRTLAMDGNSVPAHFVPGSYNDLADRKRLGWHEDYANLLKSDD